RNLQDHVSFGCIWEATAEGLPVAPRSQVACFWKSSPELDSPNFFSYAVCRPIASPENQARFKPPARSWSLVVGMRPPGVAAIHSPGPEPEEGVSIDANYLGDPRDLIDLARGLHQARAIGNSAAMRDFGGREVAPGPLDAQERERFIRDGLTT